MTVVETSETLNCYVEIEGDRHPEFFRGTACGTFLVYHGTVYGPSEIPAGLILNQMAFTPIQCWGAEPSAPEGKSYNRRCVMAGTSGILLEQVDVWTPGGTSIDTSINLTRTASGLPPVGPIIVYRAGDCYVADNDYGTGSVNLTNRTASRISEQTGRVRQWQDTTASPRATMAEMYYLSLWWQIRLGVPFASQFTTDRHDNAAGLSWEVDS
ncbi:MAG: hypothetical protein LBJ08_09470, partial [Bifidobacteriaceae bacterium]|nr:hypothetical protein [Bifidobacteriaceae bacterium]